MRIAVLILALCLTAVLGPQSCAVSVGDNLLQRSGGGAIGILVALLFVIGAAFVMGLPRVSIAAFAVAGAIGIIAGATTSFGDLSIWGGVALLLAVMSYFGGREMRRKRQSLRAEADKSID